MRYNRIETPAYILWVTQRPGIRNKSKKAYMNAVTKAASGQIQVPIQDHDIEVEITYSTNTSEGVRADVDNIIKPTLDALKGVAFVDDRLVRSVSATIFDRNKNNLVRGMVQYMGQLFYSGLKEVILIQVYSDARVLYLGGPEKLEQERMDAYLQKQDKVVAQLRGGQRRGAVVN